MASEIGPHDEHQPGLKGKEFMQKETMRRTTGLIALAATIGFGMTAPLAAQDYLYRKIAITGDVAPGAFGGTYTSFGTPYINNWKQVAFAAATTGQVAATGMWYTPTPYSLGMIAGETYLIPGTLGNVRYGQFDFSFYHPLINDDGNVGFIAPLTGIAGNPSGAFRMINGTVSKVAITGDQVPGAAAGVVFDYVGNLTSFNESDLMAFKASLAGTGVTAANDTGLYMHWFGGLNQVKREGGAVPGMPGSTFTNTTTAAIQITDTGRVGFTSNIDTAGQPSWSYWTGWPGALTLVAKTGDLSPVGLPFADFGTGHFWGMVMSQNGLCFAHHVVFNNDFYYGIWYYNGNSIETVARVGGIGPLGAYENLDANTWTVAGDGTALFAGRFGNVLDDVDTAILRKPVGGASVIIAREGIAATGYAPGVVFDDFLLSSLTSMAMDDTHRTYFVAKVRGAGINASNDTGLWVIEPNGEIRLAFRKGQLIMLQDGVVRQVQSFTFHSSIALHAGRRPAMNNEGDIALRVYFTDGDSAIIVAQRAPSCLGDINEDGFVDVSDLLMVINAWGPCANPNNCPADITPTFGNGAVDVSDLLVVINQWGPCD